MIAQLDHFVLTTENVEACLDFYTRILGMASETFGAGRLALKFGSQKINLHKKGKEFEPKAEYPTPGSLDLCFLANIPLDQVIERLNQHGVPILEGPVPRTGAQFKLRSVYIRDPDLNLIEISEKTE